MKKKLLVLCLLGVMFMSLSATYAQSGWMSVGIYESDDYPGMKIRFRQNGRELTVDGINGYGDEFDIDVRFNDSDRSIRLVINGQTCYWSYISKYTFEDNGDGAIWKRTSIATTRW